MSIKTISYAEQLIALNKENYYTKKQLTHTKFYNMFLIVKVYKKKLWSKKLNKYELVVKIINASRKEQKNFKSVNEILRELA